jgi:hypothetical protein
MSSRYPIEFPTEDLLLILGRIRGKDIELAKVLESSWIVVGYALSKAVPSDVPTVSWGEMSDEDILLEFLESEANQPDEPKGAVLPWLLLMKVALKIISNL